MTMESVPEDAAALIICSPQKDFSSEETEKILNYLQNGGKVLLFTDYTVDEMENLGRVLENYGLKKDSGIVMEGDANHYTQLGPNAFLPGNQYRIRLCFFPQRGRLCAGSERSGYP